MRHLFSFASSTFTFTSLALTRASDISRVFFRGGLYVGGGESEFKASAVEDGKKLSILQPRDEEKCGKTFAFPPGTQTCERVARIFHSLIESLKTVKRVEGSGRVVCVCNKNAHGALCLPRVFRVVGWNGLGN